MYRGVASVMAWQLLSVYRSVWLCCLNCIRDWVCVSFVLQSVIHVVVMSVYKTTSNNSSVCPYHMLIVIVLCVPD
jgi:hypothetical protein